MLTLVSWKPAKMFKEPVITIFEMIDRVCESKLIHFFKEGIFFFQMLVTVCICLKLRKMFLPILIPLLLDSEHLIMHKAATAKGLPAVFLLNLIRIYRIYDCSIRYSILPSFDCLKSVLSLY